MLRPYKTLFTAFLFPPGFKRSVTWRVNLNHVPDLFRDRFSTQRLFVSTPLRVIHGKQRQNRINFVEHCRGEAFYQ